MSNELKGRFANYYTTDPATGTESSVRLSLNSIKTNFGADIARKVLEDKAFSLGSTHRFELELLPGEKNPEETRKEKLVQELVKALYLDLRESFTGLTLKHLSDEAERLLNGCQPRGSPGMYLKNYMEKVGILKE